jgi:hypothetical protein
LWHLGQSVDFVVSITFLRSPVFAIFAMCRVFLLQGVSLHSSAVADGFNGAVICCLSKQWNCLKGAGLAAYSLHEGGGYGLSWVAGQFESAFAQGLKIRQINTVFVLPHPDME